MVVNEIYEIHPNSITETVKGFIEYKNNLIQSEWLQCREGWSTKVKPLCPHNFKRKIYWNRIRSRCF